MEEQAFLERLRRDLPRLLREHPEVRSEVVAVLEEHLVPRRDWGVILEEIRALRADFNRMMERQDRFEERQGRFEERQARFEEEMRALRADFNRMMERLERLEQGQARLEHGQRRLETTLGAIGTRWGLMAEDTFRKALAGLVEERFGVTVQRWQAYDDGGSVFGYPQQVEIDVAVQDGEHLLIELKASTSEDEVPTMLRKLDFYSGREGVPARLVLVSPFVYPGAMQALVARGVAVYSSLEAASP